jgi:acetate---CoA ligase (ADP-forming)
VVVLAPTSRSDELRDVSALLNPASIAIVGASARPDSWPARVFHGLRRFGFAGEVFLVNPKYDELYGQACYASLAALPRPPDQVVVVVPAASVPSALEEAGHVGTRSAVVLSGGFSELGTPEARALERQAVEVADAFGLRMCGPNCLGNVAMPARAVTFAEHSLEQFQPGRLACLSQSSGVMGATLRYAAQRGVGIAYGIACGNEANTDIADYLGFLADDPATSAIALFVETVRRPTAFAVAARKAARAGKPIMALTVGHSAAGRAAAAAHTGGLVGSREAFDALCDELAVVRVEGTDAFVELGELATRARRPFGPGIAAVSLSGGVRGLICDIGARVGLPFAALQERTLAGLNALLGVGSGIGNPLDIGWGGLASRDTYLACLRLLFEDPAVDVVAIQEELPRDEASAQRAEGFRQMADLGASLGKQVVFYSRGSYQVSDYGRAFHASCEAPFLQELNRAFEAVRGLREYEQRRLSVDEAPPPVSEHPRAAAWRARLANASGPLNDATAFELLEDFGIPTATWRLADSPEAAAAAASQVGVPVAVKLSVTGLTHKTEVDGVRLGLDEAANVRGAAEELLARGGPGARLLVQRMASPGTELVLSCRRDPEYGPLVLLGLGGVWVEVLRAVRVALAPLDATRAHALISGLPGGAILRGARGRPAADVEAVANVLVALSRLAVDLGPLLDTLEINPLIVGPAGSGAVAVDVVCLAPEGEPHA